jgi:hypothetical protein
VETKHLVLDYGCSDLVFYGFCEAFFAEAFATVDSVEEGVFAFARGAFHGGFAHEVFTLDIS